MVKTTTTASTNSEAMLILPANSGRPETPRLIEKTGEVSTNFKFDGQDVTISCGVTFQNKQFIFGGKCIMNDGTNKYDCFDITPTLNEYSLGVSFTVPNNFCV